MRSTKVQLGVTASAVAMSLALLSYLGLPPEMSPHAAVGSQRLDVLEASLRWGGGADARNEFGMTPLHTAACLGRSREARRLIEHGADIEARDAGGWSPLLWALFGREKARAGQPIASDGDYEGVNRM